MAAALRPAPWVSPRPDIAAVFRTARPRGTPWASATFLVCPLIGQIRAFRSFGPAPDVRGWTRKAPSHTLPERKIYLKEGFPCRAGTDYMLSSQRLTALEDLPWRL